MIQTKHTQSEQRDFPAELRVDLTSSCLIIFKESSDGLKCLVHGR